MNKIFAIVISAAFLFACGNSNEGTESTGSTDSLLENMGTVNTDPHTTSPEMDNSGEATMPGDQNPVTVGVTPQTAATAPGMNPPHGEPGHRCDISVGEPLNSAPTTPAANPVVNTTPMQTTPPPTMINTTPAPTAPTVATAPGMNPPHGEPGHDCAIAVGAPLKK
jgi:hypothetical protein